MVNKILILMLLTVLVAPLGVWASADGQKPSEVTAQTVVSPMISYQGRVLDSSGNPVDGTVSMTFRLYPVSAGGSQVWSETKNVQVSKGLFNTNLGSASPLNIAQFDQALWLEIAIGSDTLSPRQQLLASPYAFSLAPGASVEGYQYAPLVTVNNSYGDGLKGISNYGSGLIGTSKYGNGLYGDGYYGVWGNASSYGIVGIGTYAGVYGRGREGYGVYGESYNGTAGYFSTSNGYYGLYAATYRPSFGYGVYAYSREGYGIYGSNYNGTAGYFYNPGKYGGGVAAYSQEGTGVSSGSYNGSGGIFSTTNGYYGGSFSNQNGYYGLTASQYGKYGGYGLYAYSQEGTGVYGRSYNGTGGSFSSDNGYYGVSGYSGKGYGGSFSGNTGLYAYGYPGYAGYFSGNVYVLGNIYKSGSVSFVMDHPTDATKQIVYVSLEGGENGVYVRGSSQLNNGMATVKLPEHFSLVASLEGLTVQVTPTGECKGLYIVSKSPTEIEVKELGSGTSDVTFDYLVNGIRKGYENYSAIQDKLPGVPEQKAQQELADRNNQPPPQPSIVETPRLPPQLETPSPPASPETILLQGEDNTR